MFAILILVKTVEAVFQLTHLMTVNARWDGLDHTVKVSGRNQRHTLQSSFTEMSLMYKVKSKLKTNYTRSCRREE